MIGCRWSQKIAMLAGIVLAIGSSGCGGTRSFVPRTEVIPFSPEQEAALRSESAVQYRIQEGDLLKVRFAYERALDQDGVIVLSDGSVSLVGVDHVKVAGLTLAEVDSALTAAYSREYREPELSVMIQDTKGRRVYVLGEVRNPGLYAVPLGGSDLISAITMANGFTENAALDGTVVVRVTKAGYQFQEVNLASLGKPEFGLASTIPLRPYDIVYVPRSRIGNFAYFARSVLSGLGTMTRMAYDLYNIANDVEGRY